MSDIPVQFVYGLTLLFIILTIIFLKGKGSSLVVGHDTIQPPKIDEKKICKAMGICFLILTILLGFTSLFWNYLSQWYSYLFFIIAIPDMLAIVLICNLNIIFKNR